MHVGVLGGGLQGCCTALALAEKDIHVTLIERNDALLSRTAVANEGKIHLGYMYAGDPTLATARTMMRGAFAFAPFFSRYLGFSCEEFTLSRAAAYVVHRATQHSVDEVVGYANAVHDLICMLAGSRPQDYFGRDVRAPLRPWSATEREDEFDPAVAVAAFDSPEVAINPITLADALRDAISAHPRIEVRLGRTVDRAREHDVGIAIATRGTEGPADDRFNCVVNCLWDGRLALNETFGVRTERPWLHRLKYGVSFRWPAHLRRPKSSTFVSGPFGEVVSYNDGLTYLSWYPECLRGLSSDVMPPAWETYPKEPLRSQVLQGTCRALGEFIVPLRGINVHDMSEATVKGGAIIAWGKTDIYDPHSELHRRSEIGITSIGNFHSIDPGKLTMVPLFAELCANRVEASC